MTPHPKKDPDKEPVWVLFFGDGIAYWYDTEEQVRLAFKQYKMGTIVQVVKK